MGMILEYIDYHLLPSGALSGGEKAGKADRIRGRRRAEVLWSIFRQQAGVFPAGSKKRPADCVHQSEF